MQSVEKLKETALLSVKNYDGPLFDEKSYYYYYYYFFLFYTLGSKDPKG